MSANRLEFRARTIRITVDYSRCAAIQEGTSEPSCGFACVKACRLYGRNVLRIEGSKPALVLTDPAGLERLDNECLACEYGCWLHGTNCISIEIPLPGLDEYEQRAKGV